MTDFKEDITNLNNIDTEAESAPAAEAAEAAEAAGDDVFNARIRAAAMAYAKYLKDNDLAPGDATFAEPGDLNVDFDALEEEAEDSEPEVYVGDDAEEEAEADEEAAAAEVPEEIHEESPEEGSAEDAAEAAETAEEGAAEEPPEKPEEAAEASGDLPEEAPAGSQADDKSAEDDGAEKKKKKKAPGKKQLAREKRMRTYRNRFLKQQKKDPLSAVTDLHDNIQDGIDSALGKTAVDLVRGTHKITSTYRNSRRGIGIALLITGILAAAILIIFDLFTVYEYAYNGKVLGYVQEQDEVTDVLDVAGRKLSGNTKGDVGVKFVANQNVTFNLVDGRGKSTDDSDTVINKLIYMTDIETEAYAVYDGDNVVAIVKDSKDAEDLLNETMAELSVPDAGMDLVSAEFTNKLDARPVNVLLGSVQSNAAAREQMVNGGEMATYHIVEEGETAESLAAQFGVEVLDIYDEDNNSVTEVEQGDRVCIRNTVAPVSVKMVESGRIKETVEFETIKKETDEYYKGDSFTQQEGVNGLQIFEGTITKIAGEETKRVEKSTDVIRKKKDKIILIGTAERPKTAATGTFQMPIKTYVVTSEFGGRWGRMHEGMDFGAGTGTPIYAADGGEVIRSSFYSGYGLCVEIDHGNGVVTRYGHCSATLVNVGDLVYQGQDIARVGNTGNSFGSHLHFEVRINGVAQNPRNYVNP